MGVFLRWGIFGIIAVAALVYAYNALGHLADRHRNMPAGVVAPPARTAEDAPPARAAEDTPPAADASSGAAKGDAIPEKCALELDIARRAVESRSIGEPLDRLLRIQEIAWEKDDRLRAHRTELATRWFNEPGPVDAARLRRDVLSACVAAKP